MTRFFQNLNARIAASAPAQRIAPALNSFYWGVKQNAPELLTYGGIGLMAVGGITATRAAFKLQDIRTEIDQEKKELEEERKDLAEAEYRKRKAELKLKKAKAYLKAFAGSVAEFGCGAFCVLYANHMLRTEILGLGSYIAALEEANERAVEGNKEAEAGSGGETEEKKEVTTEASILKPTTNSFRFIFGPKTSNLFIPNSYQHDKMYIEMEEQRINTFLDNSKDVRKVFLINDMFRDLEMEPQAYGSIGGWIHGGGDPVRLVIVDELEDGSLVVEYKPHGIVNNLIGKVKI